MLIPDGEWVKNHFKILRNRFNRLKKQGPTGSSADQLETNWPLFQSLLFLVKVKPRRYQIFLFNLF